MGSIGAAEPDSQGDAKPQTLFENPPAPGKDVIAGILLGTLGNPGKPRRVSREVGRHLV